MNISDSDIRATQLIGFVGLLEGAGTNPMILLGENGIA
jgi:hypothetical protein